MRISRGPFASFYGLIEEIDTARSCIRIAISIFDDHSRWRSNLTRWRNCNLSAFAFCSELSLALAATQLGAVFIAPVDRRLLRLRNGHPRSLRACENCPIHDCIIKNASVEPRAAHVRRSQIGADELRANKLGAAQIAPRQCRCGEIYVYEIVPTQAGLGQIRVSKRNTTDL